MNHRTNVELYIPARTGRLSAFWKDERMVRFLVKVRREWRLFWTMEAISISYWLTFIGIAYFGNAESVSPMPVGKLESLNLWNNAYPYFVWGSTPGSLTMLALVGNLSVVRIATEYNNNEEGSMRGRSWWTFGLTSMINFVGKSPFFAIALAVWLVLGLVFGASLTWDSVFEPDIVGTILRPSYGTVTSGSVAFLCFIAGLATRAVRSRCVHPHVTLPQWCPLFIGWGVGSLVGGALVASRYAPPYVYLTGFLVVFLLGIFMFADVDILGTWVAGKIKAVTDIVQWRSGVIHWSIAGSMQVLVASWMMDLYIYFRLQVID